IPADGVGVRSGHARASRAVLALLARRSCAWHRGAANSSRERRSDRNPLQEQGGCEDALRFRTMENVLPVSRWRGPLAIRDQIAASKSRDRVPRYRGAQANVRGGLLALRGKLALLITLPSTLRPAHRCHHYAHCGQWDDESDGRGQPFASLW